MASTIVLRELASLVAALALCAAGPSAPDDSAVAGEESLAHCVPSEIGFFVEIRNADDILAALTDPQLWTALSEVAGQPASPQDTTAWTDRIQKTVKMAPQEAIRTLFARGVAFVGDGPRRSQDAVVLCRPAAATPIPDLLSKWGANRLDDAGAPAAYHLYSNIGVVVIEDRLMFGDLLPPDGMLQRLRRFGSAQPRQTLADDPLFRRLMARTPPNPDGVLYARIGPPQADRPAAPDSRAAGPQPIGAALASQPGGVQEGLQPPASAPAGPTDGRERRPSRALGGGRASASAPASQPGVERPPAMPGAFAQSEHLLIVLHRSGALLHLTAVGDGPARTVEPRPTSGALIAALPERTLAAWEGRLDYRALARRVEELPDENPIRIALKMQAQLDSVSGVLNGLEGTTCAAVGLVRPGNRPEDAPPLPAAAVLATAHDPATVARHFNTLLESCVTVYDFLSLARGIEPLPRVREVPVGATHASVLDLSRLLTGSLAPAVGELHLCWAVQGDALIVASHEDWLRQIVQAREPGADGSLSSVLSLGRDRPREPADTFLVVQSGPLADAGDAWLAYLGRTHPQLLEEGGWRQAQSAAPKLGMSVEQLADARRLRVTTIERGQPVDGFLRLDDHIVGCEGRRFQTERPVQELLTALEKRPHPAWFDLLVERRDTVLAVRVPLPYFDPVQMLRRISAVGKLAQRMIYEGARESDDGPRGALTIELRTTREPLPPFEPPVPVGTQGAP